MATMKIKDDKGQLVDLDLEKLTISTNQGSLTPDQEDAVKKLFSSGDLGSLDQATRDKLRDISARIGAGGVPQLASAVLVRFDLKWVSIN